MRRELGVLAGGRAGLGIDAGAFIAAIAPPAVPSLAA